MKLRELQYIERFLIASFKVIAVGHNSVCCPYCGEGIVDSDACDEIQHDNCECEYAKCLQYIRDDIKKQPLAMEGVE